ncbi:hypothetical protein [Bacillus thuringiensis]|uniref:hypothetical protein n=1 Tax=Bacillus thuringiensis TaxID=1428 RepID=UPI003F5B3720
MSEEKVFLHWTKRGWDTPKMFSGVPCRAEFESLEKLTQTMKNCIYNGEWVTDSKGNVVDIDLQSICAR